MRRRPAVSALPAGPLVLAIAVVPRAFFRPAAPVRLTGAVAMLGEVVNVILLGVGAPLACVVCSKWVSTPIVLLPLLLVRLPGGSPVRGAIPKMVDPSLRSNGQEGTNLQQVRGNPSLAGIGATLGRKKLSQKVTSGWVKCVRPARGLILCMSSEPACGATVGSYPSPIFRNFRICTKLRPICTNLHQFAIARIGRHRSKCWPIGRATGRRLVAFSIEKLCASDLTNSHPKLHQIAPICNCAFGRHRSAPAPICLLAGLFR